MKKQLFSLIGAVALAFTSVPVTAAETTDYSENGYSPDRSFQWSVWNAESAGEITFDGAEQNDGLFSCKWTDVQDCQFTKGKPIDGENIKYRDLGKIDCEYEMTYSADGISQYGITGWFRNGSDGQFLTEYHVVDGYNEWRPCSDAASLGQVVDNGCTYDIYCISNAQPISGDQSLKLYYSVISEKDNHGTNGGEPISNQIHLDQHFKAWKNAGLDLSDDICNISFYVLGWKCSGEANITKNDISFSFLSPETMPAIDTEDALQFMRTAGSSEKSHEPYEFRYAQRDESVPVTFTDTLDEDGSFECSWTDTNGCLFSRSRRLVNPLPYQELGSFYCYYYAFTNIAGNCNFAVRGTLTDRKQERPDIEYVIIDNYCGRKIPDAQYQPLDTVTIDNCTYDLYYIEAGTDSSGNPTPAKYLSVISREKYYFGAENAFCHIVDIDKHFDAWKAAGLDVDYDVQDAVFQITAFDGDGDVTVRNSLIRIDSELLSQPVSEETNREGKLQDGWIDYKVWTDTQTGSVAFDGEQYNTGEFNCKWENTRDFLASKGYDFRDCSIACNSDALRATTFDYSLDFKADGVASFGIRGTMESNDKRTNGSPIEFIITEGYNEWRPSAGGDSSILGQYMVNGRTYMLYRAVLDTEDANVKKVQYLAVIADQENPVKSDGTCSVRRQVSIGDHFKAWQNKGLKMDTQLYDAAFFISSWRCSGEAHVTDNDIMYPPTRKVRKGDVDCSGFVDVADAVLLARLLSEDKDAVVTDAGKRNADCDGDGSRTTADVTLILKSIARVIKL